MVAVGFKGGKQLGKRAKRLVDPATDRAEPVDIPDSHHGRMFRAPPRLGPLGLLIFLLEHIVPM